MCLLVDRESLLRPVGRMVALMVAVDGWGNGCVRAGGGGGTDVRIRGL